MPQRKILVDSNAYFRLAQTFHPLLHVEFGAQRNCLYVIRELRDEFARSPRLQTKFHWFEQTEYVENRRRAITIPRKDGRRVETTVSVIRGHAADQGLGVSRVDLRALATASVLAVPIVTDDADMLTLADDFGIERMKSLETMRLMLDCGHTTLEKVRAAAGYWRWANDLPKDYARDFRRLFDEEPP